MEKLKRQWSALVLVFDGWFLPMTALIALVCWGLGTFTPESPQWLFIQGAFVAMFICLFGLSRRVIGLLKQLEPKLDITCSLDDPRCKVPATHLGMSCHYFRALVENTSPVPLHKVTGFLDRVEKDGHVLMEQDSRRLTFEKAEDADSFEKTLYKNRPHPLDVLMATEDNMVHVCMKPRELMHRDSGGPLIFGTGDYFLRVTAVAANGTEPKTVSLKFTWTGDWRTATMTGP